ncbi:HD domain-containing protein [Plantactinospora sp. CA-290183]|uniref:HD domain-containing protein n=1 Tax=Plantactinospora sp. CA-290183 TaxID=3240006 RepID=UPI003D8BC8B9
MGRQALRTFGPVRAWAPLRAELSGRLPADTLAALDDAVDFATARHGGQTRPAGEPYLEHLLETVTVLTDGVGVSDPDMLVAAVLHDVVEDTDTTLEEVRDRFGPRVATLVAWVTKPDARPEEDKAATRARYLARLTNAPDDALCLKLADRLSNVQRLDTHPRPAKRRSYYRETVATFLPLADRHLWYATWYANWRQTFAHLDDTART